MSEKKDERLDCHVSEDECLLPRWARILRELLSAKDAEQPKG